jgi:hypothetical protein
MPNVITLLGLLAAATSMPHDVRAQEHTAGSPEAAAHTFYQSFQRGRWADMAETLHPDALDLFRTRLLQVTRNDSSGEVARQVFGSEPAELETMATDELFTRLLRGVLGYAPGMIQAMTGKGITILGHVVETSYGPEAVAGGAARDGPTAHVVMRTREPLSGSAPSRIAVISLARDGERWRVIWSEELDVIATALVAVPKPG